MEVSKERVEEILQGMLDSTVDGVWCKFPTDLTKDEQMALSKRITEVTISDRLETLLEAIFNIVGAMSDVEVEIADYDTMELLQMKEAMTTNKSDANELLIDLHSSNRIDEFFLIDLPVEDSTEEELEAYKIMIEEVITTQFEEALTKVTESLKKVIELSDKIIIYIDGRL